MRNKYKGEDVKARLGSTVIRWKNHPYFCEVDGGGLIHLFNLDGMSTVVAQIEPDDPDLDISSLTLGYVNIGHPDYKCAIYLKREAYRQYKQGVDLGKLTQVVLRQGWGPIGWQHLRCKSLVDCVMGNYPSYQEAVDLITKMKHYSVAVSRDVALKKEGEQLKVFLKDTEVGYVNLKDRTKVYVPDTDTSMFAVFFLSEIKGWEIIEGIE
jgi:hypothetical protein